jgi:hypothetical protein
MGAGSSSHLYHQTIKVGGWVGSEGKGGGESDGLRRRFKQTRVWQDLEANRSNNTVLDYANLDLGDHRMDQLAKTIAYNRQIWPL